MSSVVINADELSLEHDHHCIRVITPNLPFALMIEDLSFVNRVTPQLEHQIKLLAQLPVES